MKYSRGRIIALTLLSVTMLLALFGASVLNCFHSVSQGLLEADSSATSANTLPGFDDLYKRIPLDENDTGTVTLGQNMKLSLLEESYERGVLSNFLNASSSNRASYSDLQKRRRAGYPYPIFTNNDMRSIVDGLGNNLEIPVIMLDPYNYDDIVLFELTNLQDLPTNLVITCDGVGYEDGVNLHHVDDSYVSEQVYQGVPSYSLTGMAEVIKDTDGTTPLLNVVFKPDSKATAGYVIEIKDVDANNWFYDDEGNEIKDLENGIMTILHSSSGEQLYFVNRVNNTVTISNAQNIQLGQVNFNPSEHQDTTYEIGAVAYNGNTLRGMFCKQGLYEISFKQKIAMQDGIYSSVDVAFAFIIVNKVNYRNFPRFDTKNRVSGEGEIYNYSFENEYPTINYSKLYFDVKVATNAEYYENDASIYDDRELKFYNIGEYQLVSSLQYYSEYLYMNRDKLSKRGVANGYIPLKRYQSYASILNILGFQAYYGGQHADSRYNGPLPFFDNTQSNVSSDVSSWVRSVNMTADKSGSVVDYKNMRVSEALKYSTELANYLTTIGTIQPVRTNFPPVKINGNVAHATGAGVSGETAVVLSTVAYRPSYGTGHTTEWTSQTMDIGAPFEDAGDYVVVIYFKVNGEMCQQTFYFRIVNSAQIAFEVTANGVTNTYYAGELEVNQNLQDICLAGNKVKLSYDGQITLGQFEVLPTITLDYAPFGRYVYANQKIQMGTDGSFEFNLQQGQYRLTVKYGAHRKSTTVFNIVVDDTSATGIHANTNAKKLTTANMPENVAIVGAGEVSLTWDTKLSGIEFNNVLCEYYELTLDNPTADPNSNSNYTKFPVTNLGDLFSAYAFSKNVSSPNNGYHPIKTQSGWRLNETFQNPGLYRFVIVDAVGNETPFVLMIDNSTPTFTQSGEKPTAISNIVNFVDNVGVKIGFGTSKLVKHQNINTFSGALYQNVFNGLNQAGVLLTSGTRAIRIPLAKVERSDSGGLYYEVTTEEMQNGYIVLNQEGTFYLRVTDVLGNVGEYYIILSHDSCYGMVYAESSPLKLATGENSGRGIVEAEPNSSTSLVTNNGGMTNRPYVTFSFKQTAGNVQTSRVERVIMQYYPLTYQLTSDDDSTKPNPNYPFAEKPLNNPTVDNLSYGKSIFASQDNDGTIYVYDPARDSNGGTIRLALFNEGTSTPSGLYILTRRYISFESPDTMSRDYYFIVDNQKILYYEEDSYHTALKVHFADTKEARYPKAKDADAAVIAQNENELSSNRTAWISGFNSKYSWKHDSTVYKIKHFNYLAYYDNNQNEHEHNFNFPSLTPRFSYVNDGQTTILGEGTGTWVLGDPASQSDSQTYNLLIADNARNISCMLVDGNIMELKTDLSAPTSANWSCLKLNLETTCGTKAEIVLGENNVYDNARMQYDGNTYWTVLDPRNLDQLEFCFKSDTESMYADVNLDASMATWKLISNGVEESLTFNVSTPVNGVYTFDLWEDLFNGLTINNGDSLSVSLITYDEICTNYTILFDRFVPNYNHERVKAGDNLACSMNASDLPGDYIYGLSTDFVFERDQVNNPYLDTQVITYREVDYTGEGTQSAVAFNLYSGATGEEPIPFATLVGLRDNEMRYYYISETDYVGHTSSYIVQIQGVNYANAINFIGAISDDGAEMQIGIEMHASSSSVHQFFLHNNSFKFESGDEYYTVLGSKASWHIGNDTGSGNKSEESLLKALNTWINTATENGTKCSYRLYDRIGDVETFEFYNLRETATKMVLDCFQASATSSVITLKVKNLENLPRIMLDEDLAKLYQIKVEDRTTAEEVPNVYFSLYGATIYADITHELVITVTDPFGRTSTTEYHQQSKSTIEFSAYGNTILRDNIIYVGDERGVEFSYLRTVYTVLIYNQKTGELLNNLQSFISNDVIYYTFKPKKNLDTIELYRIVATGRASGSVLFDQTFAFDTRLPKAVWKNASDQVIEVEGQSFVSAVTLDVGKNNSSNESVDPGPFPVTISYTRKLNNQTEAVTLKPGTERVTFYKEGTYEVILRNTIWTKQVYRFEIIQINDELVLVYDDGKQINASASDYKYIVDGKEIEITRYIFTTTINPETSTYYPINQYREHGLEIKVGQTNRVLAGNYAEGTDYYEYDPQSSTIIWRLASFVGDNNGEPVYVNPIYFATTGVAVSTLNEANNSVVKISLQLNGNPNNPSGGSSAYTVVPANAAYNMIYNNFMTAARGKKLTVKLFYDDVLRDDNNAPCYLAKGNLILVDCYYNGILVKTLNYNDVFTINQNDAGYYEFVVHDLVGNYLYFGSSIDEKDINYRQNRYLLAVMTKPIVSINGKQPVSGMIYNDQVELKIDDYGNEFLQKYYQFLVNNQSIAEDDNFFHKYFCVTKMEITYTGSNGKTTEVKDINGTQTTFYWNESGDYRITMTYRIYGTGTISNELTADFAFKIIPSMIVRESFGMPIYPDIPVISVKRDGYNIHDYNIYVMRDENNDEYMMFDADNNPGSYVVTLQTYNTIIQDYVYHEIHFNIQHKANSASAYFVLSSASGSAIVGAVTLYYNPYWLYLSQGVCTITLTKDYQTQKEITIDSSILSNSNFSSQELFNVSEAGIYRVAVRDAEGDVVFSDSWTIEAEQSTLGYIVLAVVLCAAGIGLLLFIRLRHRMTTK